MNQTIFTLREFIRVIKKRYKLILNSCLGVVIVALIISLIIPPTYEAVTSLQIKPPRGLANSLLETQPEGSAFYTYKTIANYAEMIKSRVVIGAVIDKIQSDNGNYEGIIKNITVQPVKDTDIFYLKVQANSPDEAQLIANTLSETLISQLTDEQSVVREFIGQRLKESKKELEQAEEALEIYKRDQKMIGPDVQSKAMVDKFAAIDKIVVENTVNLVTAQAKLSSAQQQLAGQKPGFVADNPLIQQYKAKLAELEVELVSALPNYADKHPKIASLRAAIGETRSKLNAEVSRVINEEAASGNPIHQSLMQDKIMAEADVAAASAQKSAIANIQAKSEKDLAALPAKEHGITQLLREAQVAQEIYIMLDKRYEEARINEVMQPTGLKVLDAAVAPEAPVKPRKMLNGIVGALLGLFVGVAGALFLEYKSRAIMNDEEAKQYLNLPVLGIIPEFKEKINGKKEAFWNKISKLFLHRQS